MSFKVDESSSDRQCFKDKEEDGIDSCVDCWQCSDDNTQCKSKKKKKGKGLCTDQVSESISISVPLIYVEDTNLSPLKYICFFFLQSHKCESCLSAGYTTIFSASLHTCRTKEVSPSLCGNAFSSITQLLVSNCRIVSERRISSITGKVTGNWLIVVFLNAGC